MTFFYHFYDKCALWKMSKLILSQSLEQKQRNCI